MGPRLRPLFLFCTNSPSFARELSKIEKAASPGHPFFYLGGRREAAFSVVSVPPKELELIHEVRLHPIDAEASFNLVA